MIFIVWCLLSATIIYLFVGFPLLLSLSAKLFKKKHVVDDSYEPTVTLVVSAYNEASVIGEKIENSLNLDYPADKLTIVVVSDCSSDRTDEIVESFSSSQIKLIRMAERTGKTAGLNRAIAEIDSEMVVFSDANAIYDTRAIRKLVRHFADPAVGYVVGYAKYITASASSAEKSEGLYWNYEILLKQWESDFHSVVGGDGALYMIRRNLYQPLQETDINDFVNPLQIVAAGYRGIFDSEAFCVETASDSFEKEFGRKVRIVNRSFNGLLRVSQLLNPLKFGRFTWLLVSHKVLRWFSPFLLLSHFIVTLTLPIGFVSTLFLSLYLLLALCAVVGWAAEVKGQKASTPFYLTYYFLLMNIASSFGVIRRLRGDKIVTWSTIRDGQSRHEVGLTATFISILTILVASTVRLFSALSMSAVATTLEISIYCLFFLLLYTYFGYPLFLNIVHRFYQQSHDLDCRFEPEVTLLIAAFNEEAVIAEKLQNCLELDYPPDKLTILLVSDGSTDKTEQIARTYAEQGVQLLALSPNRGKVNALNDAFKTIATDIVVMSDANVMYRADVIRKLVQHFVDPSIGAVSGKVVLINDAVSYSAAENHYYTIEHQIQLIEGETGSLIGSDGAMYALRRELYPWPQADTILDDFVISMSIIRQGKRLIHCPEALGFEVNDQELDFEFRRKVRIVAGGIQCLLRGNIFPPRHQLLTWFKLFSHKILRWFSGVFLLLLALSLIISYTLPFSYGWLHHLIAAGVVSAVLVEALGWIIPGWRKLKLFSVVHYLFQMHAASLVGVWKGLTGGQKVTWKRVS